MQIRGSAFRPSISIEMQATRLCIRYTLLLLCRTDFNWSPRSESIIKSSWWWKRSLKLSDKAIGQSWAGGDIELGDGDGLEVECRRPDCQGPRGSWSHGRDTSCVRAVRGVRNRTHLTYYDRWSWPEAGGAGRRNGCLTRGPIGAHQWSGDQSEVRTRSTAPPLPAASTSVRGPVQI